MGLREDLERFQQIGEEKRMDLSEFIQHANMGNGDIKIPIKVIQLPEFEYDRLDQGGVAQGDGDVGEPVGEPQPGEGEGDDEAGEESGEHGYYEMDPEEFAEELDEELGLELDPKGKRVKEEKEGDLVELARSGPDSLLDFERMYKKGMKRSLAMHFDEDYMREVLKVHGMGIQKAFEWARNNNIPVSKAWIEQEYKSIRESELGQYSCVEDIDLEMDKTPTVADVDEVPLRREDKKHKHPEITKEYEKNVVVINIRDVSGSMGDSKRELVERVFTPLDWYLTGKYDNAEFRYIAHDSDAWEVDRDDFFGIKSGGGTMISSAYELAQQMLDEQYPWREWNRYVFAAGDGENWSKDTEEEVIPMMEEIDANLHAYLETDPQDSGWGGTGSHANDLIDHFGDNHENVAVTSVKSENDVMDAIKEILSTEESE